MMMPPLHRIHLMMPRVDSSGCLRKVPSKEKLILPERRVRFEREKYIVSPTTACLTEEEIAELWMTDEELKAAQKIIKEAAKSQKKNRKDYIAQAYLHVWALCSTISKDEPKAADSHACSQVVSKDWLKKRQIRFRPIEVPCT
jgi:hypothetical protein